MTSLGDSGAGTLRDTVAASAAQDSINFAVTGTINLTSGSIEINVDDLTITGPGATQLEITRSSGTFGIFNAGGFLIMSGVSITNGHADYGGAIRAYRGLSVSNCTFSGNTSDNAGGAIQSATSTAGLPSKLTNCTFTNNTAGAGTAANGYGGAISNGYQRPYQGTKLTVTNCTFSNNVAALSGGAIANDEYVMVLNACTFTSNRSNSDGGAIFNGRFDVGDLGPGGISMSSCTLTGNTAANGRGGAVCELSILNGSSAISGSTFSGNSAAAGGAVHNSCPLSSIETSTFASNTANATGGAINNVNWSVTGANFSNYSTNLTLTNNTFFNNQANSGGGVYNEGTGNNLQSRLTVSSCTFSTNAALNGGGIYNNGTNSGNAFVKVDNTILKTGGNGANLTNAGLGTSISSNGYNLSSDPGGGFLTAATDQINTDPKLGLLQANGGGTQTMALLAGSPAQDKGNASGTDERGITRPVDFAAIPNANGGNGADIGAVEMTSVPPFIVTNTADHNDGSCSLSDCTLREAINAANAASGTNTILFNSGVTGTITLQSNLGTLTVTDGVVIVGPGARLLAVSGGENIRVFNFNTGASTLSGLTIRDGWQTTGFSGDGASHFGGGIYNHDTLTLSGCNFINNYVAGANNISPRRGWWKRPRRRDLQRWDDHSGFLDLSERLIQVARMLSRAVRVEPTRHNSVPVEPAA